MRFENSKILFYFNQYFVIRLGEKIYEYNPKLERCSIFRAFITLAIYFLKNLRFKNESPQIKEFKRLVYIETINQKNALIDIFNKIDTKEESLFILHDINGKIEIADYEQIYFPKNKLYWNALLQFPKALSISKKYIRKNKGIINKSHVLINLSLFISSVKIFEKELKKFEIRQVVLTNDHNLQPLSLLLAAKNLKVPSYYIQHASVSPAFPKLLPDFALLEGQQAVDVYNGIGNLSKNIRLVGIPRLDGVLNYKKTLNTENITVGFCLKPYYSEDLISKYINQIKSVKTIGKVILRPHPGNGPAFYKRLEAFDVEISNAKIERPQEFLKKLDVLISGESSIILESALMKLKTIYIDDNVAQYDLYGFVKNKIAIPVSFEDLQNEIQQIDFNIVEENYNHCSYYCSTINSKFENKSKELIIKILQDA